ncbi:MAG: Fic family protein [Bergeyella sp.]
MDIFSLLEKYKLANVALSLEQERELIAEYIHSTNQLEGNTLTLAQTKSIIDNGEVSGQNIKTRDILEQKGTYKALIRMMKAVAEQEPLSIELMKELNWLTIGTLFQDDYYLSYKEKGQKFGDFKVKNNRILITTSDGQQVFIEPLSTPENVLLNMKMLIQRIENSEKNVIEKAAFLAQEIWLNQPFIDGNKRTARLLINFMTMKEGFPLFTYDKKGAYFNDILVNQYTTGKAGLIQDFITESLENRIHELLDLGNKKPQNFGGLRFML